MASEHGVRYENAIGKWVAVGSASTATAGAGHVDRGNYFGRAALPHRVRTIEITRIEPNCRIVYDREAVAEMARSILAEGQREPIRIWFTGRCFRITDGEKRWRATRQLGILTIKAVIVETEP